jgi:hypothetical protein
VHSRSLSPSSLTVSILSVYFLSPVLRSRFAGYLATNASLTGYIPRPYCTSGSWVCYPYLALFLVSFHSLSPLTTRSSRSDPTNETALTLTQIHSLSHRCDANATRPSLVPSSVGCAPLSSSSPPRLRLASRSSAPAFGSSWASTATPSLVGRPRLVIPLPSALAPSSILPTIYSMLHHSLPPTPPSPASCGGCDFVGSAQCPRYLQGILPRVGKLEWRVAGIDSTSAASVGAPTTMRVRERGGPWTMGAEDASTWRAEGRVDGKHTGGERVCSSLVLWDRGAR